jgi:hypothetical protein
MCDEHAMRPPLRFNLFFSCGHKPSNLDIAAPDGLNRARKAATVWVLEFLNYSGRGLGHVS